MLEPKLALKTKRIEIRAETRFTSRKEVTGKGIAAEERRFEIPIGIRMPNEAVCERVDPQNLRNRPLLAKHPDL